MQTVRSHQQDEKIAKMIDEQMKSDDEGIDLIEAEEQRSVMSLPSARRLLQSSSKKCAGKSASWSIRFSMRFRLRRRI